MSESILREGVRKNSVFIAIFFILLGVSAYRYHVSKQSASMPAADRTANVPNAPAEAPASSPQVRDSAYSPEQASDIQQTVAILAEHQKKIDANPQSEEAPALLNAMGNLNFQRLGNYKEAARCYDLLLTVYPNWTGLKPAYHQLATCYQRLGDRDNEQRIYKAMMKTFPEDSQEYAYAKKQLGL